MGLGLGLRLGLGLGLASLLLLHVALQHLLILRAYHRECLAAHLGSGE